jgi:hypothetical protein
LKGVQAWLFFILSACILVNSTGGIGMGYLPKATVFGYLLGLSGIVPFTAGWPISAALPLVGVMLRLVGVSFHLEFSFLSFFNLLTLEFFNCHPRLLIGFEDCLDDLLAGDTRGRS